MNGRPTNEEREMLIAGDRAGSLDPVEAADLALLADLLGDPSTWAEPDVGLEDDVLLALHDADSLPERAVTAKRRRLLVPAASAAAAIAVVIGTMVGYGLDTGTSADFTAKLSATAAAPAASASASVTRNGAGFRVLLDAHGLPALPAGEYYQAWLKNAAGTVVPIGTFSSSDGRVTLWSGVSPRDFRVISVTIEAADGNQAPGRHVLVGEVHAK